MTLKPKYEWNERGSGLTPTLRQDQIEDLGRLIQTKKIIHGSEPGTGKTPTVCVNQRVRWDYEQLGTLWQMPLSLIEKNYHEAIKWGGWAEGEIEMITSPKFSPNAKLYLAGYDRSKDIAPKLPAHVRAVDVDEWHKGFMSDESGRTQSLYRFCRDRKVQHLVPMTGTMFKGKPDSCYPAISLIEPRYYGNFNAFKNTHHEKDVWTGDVIGYKNLWKLNKILEGHSIRRTFEGIFGKQEVVFQMENFSLTGKQQALYEEFEEKALLELEKFWLDGTEPGVGFIRARQILEHPERFPNLVESGEWIDILNGELSPKNSWTTDYLEEAHTLGEPVLVFSALRRQQDIIADNARRVGRRVAQINGDVPLKERFRIDKAYQAGEIDTIVGSPECADVGYNWQFCGQKETCRVLFTAPPYDDSTLVQAYRRAVRGKRTKPLRVTALRYRARVDYRTFQIMIGKSYLANQVDKTREVIRFENMD